MPPPVNDGHAANRSYVDDYVGDVVDTLAPLLIFRDTREGGLLSDLDVGNFKLTNLATPTADQDATNKTYVDAALASAIADIEAEISGVYRPAGNWNAATNTPAISSPMTEADVGKVFYVETGPSNLTWQYQGVAQSDLCNVEGFSRIGIACTVEGNTIDVSGSDIGMAGACHTLVCQAGTSTTNPGVERFGFLWHTGDKLAIIEGGVITKWDNVDDVTSVNGKTGTVVLEATDITEGVFAADRIPTLAIAKITGLQAALNGKAASNHTHNAATTSAAGFMSAADKTKLNNIAANATANLGTVTNVSAGTTQVSGLTLSVATGSTTPVITTSITNAANFRTAIGAGTSSFDGNYNNLTNLPTIPAAQVQTNWNATTGMGVILNKPAWATEAQAKAGTLTTVFMNPARTFDAISVAIIDGGDLSELL